MSRQYEIWLNSDWFDSGWSGVLPRQALYLHILVASATLNEFDGDLDAMVDVIGREGFDRDTGGLDGPVWWTFPGDEDDPEQVALDRQHQELFEGALRRAGQIPPATVRALAHTMRELGLFTRELVGDVERWRAPEAMPLVAEQLDVPAAFAAEEDQRRWRMLHEQAAQAVIRHIIETLESPDHVATSLRQLGVAVELDVTDLRFAIAALIDDGDFGLEDTAGDRVDPEDVDEGDPVILRIDWDRFYEDRISLRLTHPMDPDDP